MSSRSRATSVRPIELERRQVEAAEPLVVMWRTSPLFTSEAGIVIVSGPLPERRIWIGAGSALEVEDPVPLDPEAEPPLWWLLWLVIGAGPVPAGARPEAEEPPATAPDPGGIGGVDGPLASWFTIASMPSARRAL